MLSCAAALGQARAPVARPHLADYDAELRRADGRVDIEAMVRRLEELHVTSYYWLLWHATSDWDDLKLFLPRAAEARIEVWVYLVPPSEGPQGGYPASEPFKLDYVRWAEEIARLSFQQTNLTGWVIDDFYANRKFFTPDYVRKMQARARQINPRLAFLPLMYFPEITAEFVNNYQAIIDGVVVAYPQDQDEIRDARAILKGEATTQSGQLGCPASTPTHPGDYVSAAVSARVVDTSRVRLHFTERDDFTGKTAGYHFKQLLVEDKILWEEDVAGGAKTWQQIEADATAAVQGKSKVTVAFRLTDKRGVSNFGVNWRLKDLRAEGLELATTLAEPSQWKVEQQGPFEAGFGSAVRKGEQRFQLPFIVMTAASAEEFKLRHGEPASPQRIADWLRMCLQSRQDGECDGVVSYCLDKRAESLTHPLAANLFRDARRQ